MQPGVQTLVHYPEPPHRFAAYADLGLGRLPVADRHATSVLSVPVGTHVDEAGARTVCRALSQAVTRHAAPR